MQQKIEELNEKIKVKSVILFQTCRSRHNNRSSKREVEIKIDIKYIFSQNSSGNN
jgi:hypothetical protein